MKFEVGGESLRRVTQELQGPGYFGSFCMKKDSNQGCGGGGGGDVNVHEK